VEANVTVLSGPDRALVVRERLVEISKTAGNLVIEAGLLLREYKSNAYYKEDGFESFDEAIEALHAAGSVDYGARNARNLINVVDMFDKLGITDADKQSLGISKLRDIATLKDPKEQRRQLEAAKDMSVAEVQKSVKAARDKAAGRDVDPGEPIIIRGATATQAAFFRDCIKAARVEYGINDNVPEAAVLVDAILAEWHSGLSNQVESEGTEDVAGSDASAA
jgi:hypothetical protein